MNNYKKINIVNEFNTETKEWDIKTIVIFRDNDAPIVEKYDAEKHLSIITNLVEKNGFDIIDNGLKQAIEAGVITVVSKSNQKDMAELNASILQEQIKYSSKEDKVQVGTLSKEDRELIEYFRKEILRDKGQLPPVGLAYIDELAQKNVKVAELEKARKDFNEGKITKEEFEKIHDTYRIGLADRIKSLANNNNNNIEENQKVVSQDEIVEKQTDDNLVLSEEDRELAQYFRKEILRNRGQLPPVGLAYIDELAQKNKKVAELEKVRKDLNDGKITKEEFEKIHDTYRMELAEKIKKVAINNNKVEEKTQNSSQNVDIVENNPSKRLVLAKEDRELADYFKKRILRESGKLSSDDEKIIAELTRTNERIAALEEASKRLNEGKLSRAEFDRINSVYRAQLADAIKNASTVSVVESKTPAINSRVVVDDNEAIPQENTSIEKNSTAPLDIEKMNENNDVVEVANETVNPVEILPAASDNKPVNFAGERTEKSFETMPVSPNNKSVDFVSEPTEKPFETIPVNSGNRPVNFASERTEKPFETRIPVPPVAPVQPKPPVSVSGSPLVSPNEKQNGNTTGKIDPNKPVQTVGKVEPKTDSQSVVHTPIGKVKVKATNKLKTLGKWVLAGVATLGAFLGVQKLVDFFKKPNVQHNQNQNNAVINPSISTNISSSKDMQRVINSYFNQYAVPQSTMNFIMQDDVINFLSQYKNKEQFNEVLSALCYGYEANILTRLDGNFRLDEDGNNYLRFFTSDFLCAKAVVNNYTPEQLLAVFGNSNITYEQIMDGFHGYLNTVSLYGTTAVKTLPFKYLTNNDAKSTKALTSLFDKLAVVNDNRKKGTLNSFHTDSFIVAVDELFVQNDQSLGLTEGIKTVAAAIVDAYIYSQCQVSNGEALYLHDDYGLAKAGLNLQEVDGSFSIVSLDGTAYHFTSLLDVINFGYGDVNIANQRCLSEKEILLENLSEMRELARSTSDTKAAQFANILYQVGLKEYADEVSKGNITPDLLLKIEAANPALAGEIDELEASMKVSTTQYVPFQTTVNGVDELLGIKGLKNDLATLHNIRRELLYLYDDYELLTGIRYTDCYGYYYYGGGGISIPGPKVTTKVTKEKVDYDDLTSEEKEKVDKQVEELKREEEERHKEQEESWEEGKEELREAVENGATQEELEDIAEEHGITLDPNYKENMEQALNDKENGEKLAEQIDAENERRNEEARRAAEERARQEAIEQARRREEQEALIRGETTSGRDDVQTDFDRVDENAGEQPYEETSVVEQISEASSSKENITVDQTDSRRVDTAAGEEVYVETSVVEQISETDSSKIDKKETTTVVDQTDARRVDTAAGEEVYEETSVVEEVFAISTNNSKSSSEENNHHDEFAERNENARREAEERASQEAKEQASRKAEQEALIRGEDTSTKVDVQTDSERVDTAAGEQAYESSSDLESRRAELNEMKEVLNAVVEVEQLDLEETQTQEAVKTK